MILLNVDDLGLTAPESYDCVVWSYLVSHSLLLVRALKDDSGTNDEMLASDLFYLLFSNVRYFEGGFAWQGINFDLGTSEECLQLMRLTNGSKALDIPDEAILKYYHLIKFSTPQGQIRVLASDIRKIAHVPKDFFWLTNHRQ